MVCAGTGTSLPVRFDGTSPRVWGNPAPAAFSLGCGWYIPARAGRPRLRTGKRHASRYLPARAGRYRDASSADPDVPWHIPARGGQPVSAASRTCWSKVPSPPPPPPPPPRARGSCQLGFGPLFTRRFIPARAGWSWSSMSCPAFLLVHPRARGSLSLLCVSEVRRRFIPARAGRSSPAVCGSNSVTGPDRPAGCGLSLVFRHVTIFGRGHGLQRAIIDESQHRTPEHLIMAQH